MNCSEYVATFPPNPGRPEWMHELLLSFPGENKIHDGEKNKLKHVAEIFQ